MTTRIDAEETEAYRILPGAADRGLVLLCDHAENTLPGEYGTLGLPAQELSRHIAYDIGAAPITEIISEALGVPAVLSQFSRLLIDPNRGEDDPTLIMRLSDGAIIPGNRHATGDERARRIARHYRPYHDAIERVVERCLSTGAVPAIFSIHSMTDRMKGVVRPWQVSILWDRDPRLAIPLLEGFRADPALTVGDNEPYKGWLANDCLWTHATGRGLANALIEYRQDLVADAAGQRAWAERTVGIIRSIMACPRAGPPLRRIEMHGSRSQLQTRVRTTMSLSRYKGAHP